MLYIFGDSFCLPNEHRDEIVGPGGLVKFMPLEKNWTSIVCESLTGASNSVNESMLGCSNEYVFHKLSEWESSFKSGDCVIVQLTSFYREWFFEDKPHMANYMTAKFTPGIDITKEENTALEMYKRYLYSEHRLFLHYNAMFDAITLRTRLYAEHGIRCLVLPGFHNIIGVEGNMLEASSSEFDCDKTATTYYNKTGDLRFNHFSEVNHKILANKVIDFFNTGKTVDLTIGFETGIYTKDNI
jgi:hypothetical protein